MDGKRKASKTNLLQRTDTMKILLISTTVEQKEDAERIAALLLEKRLVACAQISAPITSIYRWRGEVTKASEVVLSLKTLGRHYSTVEKILLQEHPYEIPEIIFQEDFFASESYSRWLEGEIA